MQAARSTGIPTSNATRRARTGEKMTKPFHEVAGNPVADGEHMGG